MVAEDQVSKTHDLSYPEWVQRNAGLWPYQNTFNHKPEQSMDSRKAGQLILSNGCSVAVPGLDGYVTLRELMEKAAGANFATNFRTHAICMIGKCGKHAAPILPKLRELTREINHAIAETARTALKLIEMDIPTSPSGRTMGFAAGIPGHGSGDDVTYNYPHQNVGVGHSVKRVEITTVNIEELDDHELVSDAVAKVHCKCNFCEKQMVKSRQVTEMSERLAGPGRLYCPFCLRHEYYKRKISKHVMVVSLRGIIGYYWHAFNVVPKTSTMYGHELGELLDHHVRLGQLNPLFKYDPETFCWFIDFSRVGRSKRRLSITDIMETVTQMVMAFDMYSILRDAKPHLYWKKLNEGIRRFYKLRQRPPRSRVFAPTLLNCGLPADEPTTPSSKVVNADYVRGFIMAATKDEYYGKKSGARW